MQDHSKRFLRVLLLFSFVSLMLCPYAEIITAGHGGKILIHQDDFKKNRKMVINAFQPVKNPVFLKSHDTITAPAMPAVSLERLPVEHQRIGLFIFSTVQLLL